MNTISLKRNFVWTILGNVVLAAAQWGMLVALARLGNAELVGRYALALTITAPLILLCNLQLRVVQATDAVHRFAFPHFLRLRILTCAVQVALIAAISLALGYASETVAVIVALGAMKVFEGVSDICYGLQQKHERMSSIAVSQMIRGVVSLTALAGVLMATGSLLLAVLAMGAGWLGLLVAFDIPQAQRIRRLLPSPPVAADTSRSLWPEVAALFRTALPLGFVSMLISSFWTFPRYLLEDARGEAVLGHFAVMAYFIVPVTTIVEALGQSAISRLARLYRGDLDGFRRLFIRLLGIAAILGGAGVAVAVAAGHAILHYFYGPEYAAHASLFPLLMAVGALIALCSVAGVALTAAGFFRVQLWILVAVLAMNIAAGWRLIPGHGMAGAVWTVIAGASIWFLLALGGAIWISRRPAARAAGTG